MGIYGFFPIPSNGKPYGSRPGNDRSLLGDPLRVAPIPQKQVMDVFQRWEFFQKDRHSKWLPTIVE